MPPCARRSPVWSNGEVLDLISVWWKEAVQSQLHSSRRNYDTYGQISRAMIERGHDQDAVQCRVKGKELWTAYHKAWEANCRSGAAPTNCRFYKELDVILGGNSTFTLKNTMEASEAVAAQSSTRQEEESGSKGAEEEGGPEPKDGPASLDACSQELFSSQEEGSQSQWTVLGEEQTSEEVPDTDYESEYVMHEVQPIVAPTRHSSPLQANGGCRKRHGPRDMLSALPAATIGLERRTAASGNHDRPNLQTRPDHVKAQGMAAISADVCPIRNPYPRSHEKSDRRYRSSYSWSGAGTAQPPFPTAPANPATQVCSKCECCVVSWEDMGWGILEEGYYGSAIPGQHPEKEEEEEELLFHRQVQVDPELFGHQFD
ncbi:Zinc finger and SCAN domain-containing protein 29 [Chelonia mydas]|uniref:Zinc finger and SCAN domain-containing protein 29 n=1 Tax=Chelonia mydas TaxID=8469 RepID=M7BFR5_CHEMY|nr:Zinc finger and SCAN domain-containing protein 29 [Chelonia mydas]